MSNRRKTIHQANTAIRDFADHGVLEDDIWEFFCECGCFTLVELTIAQFDSADDGVWADGHQPGQQAIPVAS